MPFKITKRKDGGVLCEYEGLITPEENTEAHNKIFGKGQDRLNKISYVMSDYSKVKNITHTHEEIRRHALMVKHRLEIYPKTVFAIILPSDLMFAYGRVWSSNVGEENRASVFRTKEEAKAWVKERLSKGSPGA